MDKRKRAYFYITESAGKGLVASLISIGIKYKGKNFLSKRGQMETFGCTPIKVRWCPQKGGYLREGAFISVDVKFLSKVLPFITDKQLFNQTYIWDDEMEKFYSQKMKTIKENRDAEYGLLERHEMFMHSSYEGIKTEVTLSKEWFVNTMTELLEKRKKCFEWLDNLEKVFPSSFESIFEWDCFETTIKIISELLNDKEGWLDYFVFEKDCSFFSYTQKLGDTEVEVPVDTLEDLFDLILSSH